MVFALFFAGLALIAISFYQLAASRYNRLVRREDVIARWVVCEREWKHFVLEEPARNSAKGADTNIIELNPKMSSPGVEVVVGKMQFWLTAIYTRCHALGSAEFTGLPG